MTEQENPFTQNNFAAPSQNYRPISKPTNTLLAVLLTVVVMTALGLILYFGFLNKPSDSTKNDKPSITINPSDTVESLSELEKEQIAKFPLDKTYTDTELGLVIKYPSQLEQVFMTDQDGKPNKDVILSYTGPNAAAPDMQTDARFDDMMIFIYKSSANVDMDNYTKDTSGKPSLFAGVAADVYKYAGPSESTCTLYVLTNPKTNKTFAVCLDFARMFSGGDGPTNLKDNPQLAAHEKDLYTFVMEKIYKEAKLID